MTRRRIAVFLSACAALVGVGVGACQSVKSKQLSLQKDLTYEPPALTKKPKLKLGATPGRYLGYFRPFHSQYKLPLTLDLVGSRAGSDTERLTVFAKYSLSSFGGREFRVEYYPQVVFHRGTGSFSVGEHDGQLGLTDMKLEAQSVIVGKVRENGEDLGDFLVVYSGERKDLDSANLLRKIFPQRSIFPALAGHYFGTCEQKAAVLDIETVRWDHQGATEQGFLRNHRVAATWAAESRSLCIGSAICAKRSFDQAVLDIRRQSLVLKNAESRLNCTMEGENKLSCDKGCAFEKQDLPAQSTPPLEAFVVRQTRQDRVNLNKTKAYKGRVDFPGPVSGEYFGYLFNETTLNHQLYRLKVTAKMAQEPGMKKPAVLVDGVSTIFLGDGQSNEFSVNRFLPEFYSPSNPHLIFSGHGDQVVQVSTWGPEGIRAILYSKNYGRVGTLELAKSQVPALPAGATLVNQLTGKFDGHHYQFTLLAQPDISESPSSFFPLNVRGYAEEPKLHSTKSIVQQVTYDFYSGQYGMLMDDGRLIVGQEAGSGFDLVWKPAGGGSDQWTLAEPSRFYFVKDTRVGTTAVNVLDAVRDSEHRTY